MNILQEIIRENKKGHRSGIYSCCSANADVIRAVLVRARKTKTVALIESTSNQVNQDGGYTGMTRRVLTAGASGDSKTGFVMP